MKKNKKKLLFIGWDAADWSVIMPLVDEGKMPALKKIIEGGVIGNIATLDPPLSPMLWTSIATGKFADKHGILGFIEPDTLNGGVRSMNSTSRKTRALWNILHNQGYYSNVIGWWPSHPVEPINGSMVSNFYQRAKNAPGQKWSIMPNSVHPKELEETIAHFRVHPIEISEQHILPFIPDASKVDQVKTNALESLAKILADTATVHATATYLMDNSDWDFTAVYFDGIDHFCHGFMKYHPPKIQGMPDELFNLYKDVVKGGYIFHDMMLETYLNMIDDDTIIVLASDHGFHSGALRPKMLPKVNAAPAMEHNPLGVVCFYGPGIRKDERIHGATLVDICPTILAALDLPVGTDMDGKILGDVFVDIPEVKYIDSWDEVDGDFGEHAEHQKEDSESSVEALQQLVELGYIEDPGEDKNKAMQKALSENQYNLSRVLKSRRKTKETVDILMSLFEENPKDIRYNMDLIQAFIELGDPVNARKHLKVLEDLPEDDDFRKFVNFDLIESRVLIAENRLFKAEEKLNDLLSKRPNAIGALKEAGKLFYNIGKFDSSSKCFDKILLNDPGSSLAYFGLSRNNFMLGNYEAAADNALSAIGIIFNQPRAHYILGESLFQLGLYSDSVNAFELTLTMNMYHLKARNRLIEIYTNHIKNEEKLSFHEKFLEDYMKGTIIIVSGLPRSGTSMMMQMLESGGLEILSDGVREADNNNPKGYYEYEKVKSLARDNSWLEVAEGKVVKVIAQLLRFLPNTFKYKVVFMERDMTELLKSQQIMLNKDPNVYPMTIANVFEKELQKTEAWAETQPNIEMLNVKYSDVINNPMGMAEKVNTFLNNQLDVTGMTKAIDKKLYRNKQES